MDTTTTTTTMDTWKWNDLKTNPALDFSTLTHYHFSISGTPFYVLKSDIKNQHFLSHFTMKDHIYTNSRSFDFFEDIVFYLSTGKLYFQHSDMGDYTFKRDYLDIDHYVYLLREAQFYGLTDMVEYMNHMKRSDLQKSPLDFIVVAVLHFDVWVGNLHLFDTFEIIDSFIVDGNSYYRVILYKNDT